MTATSPTPFRELLEALRSPSKDGQNRAFEGLLNATENPVSVGIRTMGRSATHAAGW